MKNYIVESLIEFDDYEGLECIPKNHKEHRKRGDIFYCTKERYEFFKSKYAVVLRGIEKSTNKVSKKKDSDK